MFTLCNICTLLRQKFTHTKSRLEFCSMRTLAVCEKIMCENHKKLVCTYHILTKILSGSGSEKICLSIRIE